jgi:hypothetical protein
MNSLQLQGAGIPESNLFNNSRVAGWLTGYSGGCSEAAAGGAVDQISRERPKREELDNGGRVLTYYIKR